MSATRTRSLAAGLIAEALLDDAAISAAPRRLYLGEHLGVRPEEVFRELAGMCDTEIVVRDVALGAVSPRHEGSTAYLIPYLVTDAASAGRNHGSEGFGALLRNAFLEDAKGQIRVLLILAERPVDTVMTASEDAAHSPNLAATALVARAARLVPDDDAGAILRVIADDAAHRFPPDGSGLDDLLAFLLRSWRTPADIGAAVHELPFYVRFVPRSDGRDRSRLSNAARWRQKIGRWAVPGEDFAGHARQELQADETVAERVAAAKGPFAVDYSGFDLDDLDRASGPARPTGTYRLPLEVGGARASLAIGYSIAAWIDRPGDITLRLAGRVGGDLEATVAWAGGTGGRADVDAADGVVRVHVPADGWQFGELSASIAGRALPPVLIACYSGRGTWFPVEERIALDARRGAFIVEGEARVVAVAGGGKLSPLMIAVETQREPGSVVSARTELASETHEIPLLLSGEGIGEHGEGANGDQDDGAGPEPGSGASSSLGALPQPTPPVASPVHAQLHASRTGGGFQGGTFGTDEEGVSVVLGSSRYLIEPRGVRGRELLDWERYVLENPETLAFVAGSAGLAPDPYLERIPLASIPDAARERFIAARRALFETLRPAGSAYAVATGVGRAEAMAYVATYAELLGSIETSGPYRREYDRLVLVDSIVAPDTAEILFAPTNPLTLAFYLAFSAAAEAWTDPERAALTDNDIASITPRHLVPLISLRDSWYEGAPGPGFLWRSFKPLRAQQVVEHEPRFIADRIRFFLDVHAEYKDPRQRLSIAFFQPGDGRVVRQALCEFYKLDAGLTVEREEDYQRPQLDIHLFTPGGLRPQQIDELLARDEPERAEEVVRSRVTISVHDASARRSDTFYHVAFVFRAPVQRGVRAWDMSSRAATTYAGGLATAPGRHVVRDATELTYGWGTFAADLCGDAGSGEAASLLGRSLRSTLELIGGQPRERLERFVTRMPSSSVSHDAELYSQAVWVVHLDRLLGLEAVGFGSKDPVYLIDYEEQANPATPGYDAITATYRVDPYRAAIGAALRGIAAVQQQGVDAILQRLNSVSGTWALELLRRPPHLIAERVGTVGAIAMLDDLDRSFGASDALAALLPLPEVLRLLAERGIEPPTAPASDDLLLLRIPLGRDGDVRVSARIVEVKYTGATSSAGPDFARARAELVATRARLQEVFAVVGPARLFRARDLAELIRAGILRRAAFEQNALAPDGRIETALQKIASGTFSFSTSYWVGGQRLEGDVIWIDARSRSQTERSDLPGAGEPFGLIRAGKQVLERLGEGKPLTRPAGWLAPVYEPPRDGGRKAKEVAPTPDVPPPVTASEPRETRDEAALQEEIRKGASELTQAALKYELELEPFSLSDVQVGPTVLRFRTRPLGRQSLAGVQRRALDLGREVGSAEGVIVGQEPYFITIDVPRKTPEIIRFGDYAGALDEPGLPGELRFLIGMAPLGDVRVADLARLPHLLVAGATGSGKSVFLRSVVTSLIRQHSPEVLRLLIVDPKQVDYAAFEQLPHLVGGRIITDPGDAVAALSETIQTEIEKRRPVLKRTGATSALDFYEAGGSLAEMPQMVIVVDEFADLVQSMARAQRSSFLSLVQRYGQLTRAFGIYLVLATQRPSVQVITGDIKANLTARVALKLLTAQDSMTILGHGGAENLRDRGDLLFSHGSRLEHLQGFLTTPAEARSAGDAWIE